MATPWTAGVDRRQRRRYPRREPWCACRARRKRAERHCPHRRNPNHHRRHGNSFDDVSRSRPEPVWPHGKAYNRKSDGNGKQTENAEQRERLFMFFSIELLSCLEPGSNYLYKGADKRRIMQRAGLYILIVLLNQPAIYSILAM